LDILAARDFIFGDSIVHNEVGQDSSGQHLHGTAVLSACAGYSDSMLIGPAFGVSVMLAKTEWTESETQVEEDYYVAAMEWADSAGADITSSSLGYLDWYTQDQMDGRTAVTTLAVIEATRRGILVVTAAGNERESEWGTIISPADADSILAIGGIDSLGVLSTFSSPGPSADGRIKPDCAAMATEVLGANGFADDLYWRLSGTSLATPIAAGVCALIIEAHPEWTSQQIRQAILRTASQADAPDNDLGYGVINGPAAVDYIFDSAASSPVIPASVRLTAFPNPVNGFVTLSLTLRSNQSGKFILYDLLGRRKIETSRASFAIGFHEHNFSVESLASGKYFATFQGSTESATIPLVVIK
jgi:subtilisin family serine protease